MKSHLGPKGIAEFARILGLADGALDALIGAKVEAAVHDLRRVVTNGVAGNGYPVSRAPGA